MYRHSKKGQSVVEYAMFVLLIGVISFVALNNFVKKSGTTAKINNVKTNIHLNAAKTPLTGTSTYTLKATSSITSYKICYHGGTQVACSDCSTSYPGSCTFSP